MNKKRLFSIMTLIVVLALTVGVLVACNSYKWDSIGMGDSSANVVSNGGYYVEQGKYVYFINGYVGDNADNTWGTPYKQSIMRAEKKEDGTIDNESAKVVVPKSIYNGSKNGGFAIYGDWIYYATPNNDEDKSGTPSTTHTDFMRTKTDGSVTQLIATINSRSSEYLFTPTRVLYRTDTSTVYYVDFSGMRTDKSIDNGKGAYGGTLIENATSILWGYDADWSAGGGTAVTDYVFYTQTVKDDAGTKFYNNVYAVKYDGSEEPRLLFSGLAEGQDVNDIENVFNYTLVDMTVDGDDTATLYYTKKIDADSNADRGLYENTFSISGGMGTEHKLADSNLSSFYPLGYGNGILATANSNVYFVNGDGNYSDENLVIGASRSATVQAVIDGYVYYTAGSDGALYRVNMHGNKGGASANETEVIKAGVKSDWLNLEFVDGRLFYFDTEDYSYIHYADLDKFDGEEFTSKTTTLVGKMTQADADAKAEAEKEEEEENA